MSFDDMVDGGVAAAAAAESGADGVVLTKMMTIVLDTNLRLAHPIAI